jgi:uncharacterized protein YjbI with pentapeptide repeats
MLRDYSTIDWCNVANGSLSKRQEEARDSGTPIRLKPEDPAYAFLLSFRGSGNPWSTPRPSLAHFDYSFDYETLSIIRRGDASLAGILGTAADTGALAGADLRGAGFQRADLSISDLRKVLLGGADLREANLFRADLREGDLQQAKLEGASLNDADLRKANFTNAKLARANLDKADISGAYFVGAEGLNEAKFLRFAFYCQDEEPAGLKEALTGVNPKQHPMALTRQEYDELKAVQKDAYYVKHEEFYNKLRSLRHRCDYTIDLKEQIDKSRAQFGLLKTVIPDQVVVMFSSPPCDFSKENREDIYGNGIGGKALQGISNVLERLNHLAGRGYREDR